MLTYNTLINHHFNHNNNHFIPKSLCSVERTPTCLRCEKYEFPNIWNIFKEGEHKVHLFCQRTVWRVEQHSEQENETVY
jgi:NMD protein affecting ribosome stability and mRNA decay